MIYLAHPINAPLLARLLPEVRRRDVRVTMIVDQLARSAFVTADDLVAPLQRARDECAEALETASKCVVDEEPLIRHHRGAWVFGARARNIMRGGGTERPRLRRAGIMWYDRPDAGDATVLARAWLAHTDRISSGDYAVLAGVAQPVARRTLERLAEEGVLTRGATAGRNAHFVLADG